MCLCRRNGPKIIAMTREERIPSCNDNKLMPRRRRQELNRGRVQAQGAGVEKSCSWAEAEVPTKEDGHGYLDNLKGQLTPAEQLVRESCFEKALKWVNDAPAKGYVVVTPIKTSFQPYPPIKDTRVDGELHSGASFKDN